MIDIETLSENVRRALGSDCLEATASLGELCVVVPAPRVAEALRTLRDDPAVAMAQLMDVCGVDYPDRSPVRFEVVYNLLSLRHNARLRVKVRVAEGEQVPTATGVYSSAGWFERETWDMFGIAFSGHPDLRRILTEYEFEGHPLRKDFPLWGHTEVRYDEDRRRVIHQPAKPDVNYRDFDFISPWQGDASLTRNAGK